MTTCANPKCGKRLIPVPLPDGTLSTLHPTPQCDPHGELDASRFPESPKPELAEQEPQPQ